MSASNGHPVFTIGRKGRSLVALGDGEPREIDVIDLHNQWIDIDATIRDPETGKIPPGKASDANRLAWQFASEVFNTTDLSQTEALEFLKFLTEESNRLSSFFAVKFDDAPSSPKPSEVIYSE